MFLTSQGRNLKYKTSHFLLQLRHGWEVRGPDLRCIWNKISSAWQGAERVCGGGREDEDDSWASGPSSWAGRPLTEEKGTGWPLGSSVFDMSELEAEMWKGHLALRVQISEVRSRQEMKIGESSLTQHLKPRGLRRWRTRDGEAGRPGAVLSRPTGRRCCFNARGRRALLGATDRNPTAGYGMEQQECEWCWWRRHFQDAAHEGQGNGCGQVGGVAPRFKDHWKARGKGRKGKCGNEQLPLREGGSEQTRTASVRHCLHLTGGPWGPATAAGRFVDLVWDVQGVPKWWLLFSQRRRRKSHLLKWDEWKKS